MNSVSQWLRRADPIAHEEPPTFDEIQRMRRHLMAAVDATGDTAWQIPQLRLLIAAIALIASFTAPLTHLWESRGAEVAETPSAPGSERLPDKRQLQFDTPGGTRVIWVFNSEFEP